jgi:hypothetical protein
MNPDYCQCNEFEKAVECQDIVYCKLEDDRYGAVKKPGWYIYAWGYHGPKVSLEPLEYCPWCSKKLPSLPNKQDSYWERINIKNLVDIEQARVYSPKIRAIADGS